MKGKNAANETFAKLCQALPYGYSRIITDRLAERGISTTPRNVQYVANGQTSNPDIEEEILKLLDEKIEKHFENEVKKRLDKLK